MINNIIIDQLKYSISQLELNKDILKHTKLIRKILNIISKNNNNNNNSGGGGISSGGGGISSSGINHSKLQLVLNNSNSDLLFTKLLFQYINKSKVFEKMDGIDKTINYCNNFGNMDLLLELDMFKIIRNLYIIMNSVIQIKYNNNLVVESNYISYLIQTLNNESNIKILQYSLDIINCLLNNNNNNNRQSIFNNQIRIIDIIKSLINKDELRIKIIKLIMKMIGDDSINVMDVVIFVLPYIKTWFINCNDEKLLEMVCGLIYEITKHHMEYSMSVLLNDEQFIDKLMELLYYDQSSSILNFAYDFFTYTLEYYYEQDQLEQFHLNDYPILVYRYIILFPILCNKLSSLSNATSQSLQHYEILLLRLLSCIKYGFIGDRVPFSLNSISILVKRLNCLIDSNQYNNNNLHNNSSIISISSNDLNNITQDNSIFIFQWTLESKISMKRYYIYIISIILLRSELNQSIYTVELKYISSAFSYLIETLNEKYIGNINQIVIEIILYSFIRNIDQIGTLKDDNIKLSIVQLFKEDSRFNQVCNELNSKYLSLNNNSQIHLNQFLKILNNNSN